VVLGASEGAGLAAAVYGLVDVAVVGQGGHGLPNLMQVVSAAQGIPHLHHVKSRNLPCAHTTTIPSKGGKKGMREWKGMEEGKRYRV
jgi:hypothetical protein